MSEPRVVTMPFGGPPLTRAALAGRCTPRSGARARRVGATEWRARCECDARRRLRARLGKRARAGAPGDGRGGRAARAKRGREGVVVTTGQQPGLFGGPVYTWSKALSALALADALERATGIPTAPVFWAATYDADFAESAPVMSY